MSDNGAGDADKSPNRSDKSPDRSVKSQNRSDKSHDRSSSDKSPRGRKRSRTRSRSRSRSRSAGSNRDDRRRPRRRYNNEGRCELRLLIRSKDAGSIIGRGGANIKRLRQDCQAGVTISDSHTPERIVSIAGEVKAISEVLDEILKQFEEKHDSSSRRGETEVEGKMLIHQSQAGCVIGKAGTKLKEIRLEAGVDMKVYPQCCPRSTERIIQVVGRPHNVSKCITNVVDMLKTWPPRGPSDPYDPANYDEIAVRDYGGYQDDDRGRGGRGRDRDSGRRSSLNRDRGGGGGGGGMSGMPSGLASLSSLLGGGGRRTTQQVSIPADLAGVIIGKGGQNIRQIRIDSGADVELSDPTGGPGDRIITITGNASEIQNAQFMLQMSVKQHLARN